MQKPYIIALTGGTGSGKTHIAKRILESLGEENAVIFSQDNYYVAREKQPRDHNNQANFDLPESLDLVKYAEDLKQLSLGYSVFQNKYTYNNPAAQSEMIELQSNKIIILEGIFVCYLPELLDLIDLKIFIETDEEVKLERRVNRDLVERGYDREDVLYKYEHHITPAFLKYVAPQKYVADIIIPNSRNNAENTAVELIINHLKFKVLY